MGRFYRVFEHTRKIALADLKESVFATMEGTDRLTRRQFDAVMMRFLPIDGMGERELHNLTHTLGSLFDAFDTDNDGNVCSHTIVRAHVEC